MDNYTTYSIIYKIIVFISILFHKSLFFFRKFYYLLFYIAVEVVDLGLKGEGFGKSGDNFAIGGNFGKGKNTTCSIFEPLIEHLITTNIVGVNNGCDIIKIIVSIYINMPLGLVVLHFNDGIIPLATVVQVTYI